MEEQNVRKGNKKENEDFRNMSENHCKISSDIKEREKIEELDNNNNEGEDFKKTLKEKHFRVEMILTFIITICIIAICIIVKNMENKTNEYASLESRYNQTKEELEKNKNTIKEKDKEIEELKKEENIKELENKIIGLNSDITNLQSKKDSLNTEIEHLKEDVIKVKGESKTYPAGQLIAGTDVPTGKYKIYGGSSNFIVHSSYGDLKVNIILGENYGVNEYIYTFKQGDKIEARSSFKLVAVE